MCFVDVVNLLQQYLPLYSRYAYMFVSHCKENDTIEFRVRGIETKKLIKDWIETVGDLSNTQYKVWKTYKPQKDNTFRVSYRVPPKMPRVCWSWLMRLEPYTIYYLTMLKCRNYTNSH